MSFIPFSFDEFDPGIPSIPSQTDPPLPDLPPVNSPIPPSIPDPAISGPAHQANPSIEFRELQARYDNVVQANVRLVTVLERVLHENETLRSDMNPRAFR